MIERFVEQFVHKIAINPSVVRVESEKIESNFIQITIFASSQDTGRLIGKDGKMIGAIKTLVAACKAKNGCSYKITVKAVDDF
ncbi:RNA-binding protein [Helicobacter monodelphidis]|uniref:KH domain-containing protein n=1 Tax=Helicobacter sp. 15-1451 TaxID=2004995 RepID=UPI000DCCEF95|nr:KH domain-containing protein [Helicobacter sp. 15-1451]RAX58446.1 RNA-binding protein [Helicobacter sp. 15-1451]